ncbi:MAG: hypothetical protein ACK5LC_07080 [Coprobacillaceae bacterium]
MTIIFSTMGVVSATNEEDDILEEEELPLTSDGEEITIYNSTMGEILEAFAEEEYDELTDKEKRFYDSLGAEEILAPDEDSSEGTQEIIPNKEDIRARSTIWVPTALVLTQALYSRASDTKVTYGGMYNCTSLVKIFGSAYLIRNSDGKILYLNTTLKAQGTYTYISKTYTLAKSSEKYYTRSFGTYTNSKGATVSTSASSWPKN